MAASPLIIDRRQYLGAHRHKYNAAHDHDGPPILAQWRIRCTRQMRLVTWYGRIATHGPKAGTIQGGKLSIPRHTGPERVLMALARPPGEDANKCNCTKTLETWRTDVQTVVHAPSWSRRGGGNVTLPGTEWKTVLKGLKYSREKYTDPLRLSGTPSGKPLDMLTVREAIHSKAKHLLPMLHQHGFLHSIPGTWAGTALGTAPTVYVHASILPTNGRAVEAGPDGRARWEIHATPGSHQAEYEVMTIERASNGQWYEVPGTRRREPVVKPAPVPGVRLTPTVATTVGATP